MNSQPCNGYCPERSATCHATCERGKAREAENVRIRDARNRIKSREGMMIEYSSAVGKRVRR
jgi:threonine synthase